MYIMMVIAIVPSGSLKAHVVPGSDVGEPFASMLV